MRALLIVALSNLTSNIFRFVVTSLLRTRHQTAVAKKTVNPTYAPKDATWDFPIYLSLADKLGVVELVVWDKDVLRKDYLGEAGVAVDDWFTDARAKAWDAPGNVVRPSRSSSRLPHPADLDSPFPPTFPSPPRGHLSPPAQITDSAAR